MLITTMNDIPGQRIEKVFGELFVLQLPDDDPDQPDEDRALAALTEVIAGPEGVSDPDVADRAHQIAADIMDMHGEVWRQPRGDGPPAGSV